MKSADRKTRPNMHQQIINIGGEIDPQTIKKTMTLRFVHVSDTLWSHGRALASTAAQRVSETSTNQKLIVFFLLVWAVKT